MQMCDGQNRLMINGQKFYQMPLADKDWFILVPSTSKNDKFVIEAVDLIS